MNKAEKVLNKIATLLGITVELEQVKLVDGQTVLEADTFEAGKDVFVVTEEGNIPVPAGNYELETGQILVVEQDGVIKEIMEAEAEEEEAEVEAKDAEEEMGKDKEKLSDKPVRRTIESIVKETVFSKVEELSAENETLKAELSAIKAELEKEKETKVELSTEKRIKHNPEPKAKEAGMKYGEKGPKGGVNAILNKIYNK
jgi:predicted RNase H-like nuclease (RuvC/YqgF family)